MAERLDPNKREEAFLDSSLENFLPDSPYVLPKSGPESNRMDLQHNLLRQVFGANYSVPLAPARSDAHPTALLDSGCGTGRWVQEMARAFPTAQVTGIDLVTPTLYPDEPEQNTTFLQGDILEGLPFPDASFDFVHQRLLASGIPAARWSAVVADLVRVTRPGGWIELAEGGFFCENSGPANDQWSRWINEICQRRGIDAQLIPRIGEFLQAAGLQGVETRTVQIPLGSWGGQIGILAASDGYSFIRAIEPLVRALSSATAEEQKRLITNCLLEWERRHCSWPFYLAYGQRPG